MEQGLTAFILLESQDLKDSPRKMMFLSAEAKSPEWVHEHKCMNSEVEAGGPHPGLAPRQACPVLSPHIPTLPRPSREARQCTWSLDGGTVSASSPCFSKVCWIDLQNTVSTKVV